MAKSKRESRKKPDAVKSKTPRRSIRSDGEAAGGDAGLAMVRDLLFGRQMRASEEKLSRVERLIRQEVNRLRTEVRGELKALNAAWKSELGALQAQLDAEARERAEADDKHRDRLGGLGQRLDRKIERRGEKSTQSLQSLRKRVTAVSRRLETRFSEGLEGAAASLREEIEALRDSGADRDALAALFTELGKRVGEGPTRS